MEIGKRKLYTNGAGSGSNGHTRPPAKKTLPPARSTSRKRYWEQRDIAWDRYRGTRHPSSTYTLRVCVGKYVRRVLLFSDAAWLSASFFLSQCLSPAPAPPGTTDDTILLAPCPSFVSIIILLLSFSFPSRFSARGRHLPSTLSPINKL